MRLTTLTRLVASVRDRAAARLWRILAELPSPEQRGRLLSLLRPPKSGNRTSYPARPRLERGCVSEKIRRETPFFSDRERAALAWTEALTLISETHAPQKIYEEVREAIPTTRMPSRLANKAPAVKCIFRREPFIEPGASADH